MKKNILYVIDGLYGGGKERQLVEIIKYLNNDGNYQVGVITFNKNKHYTEYVRNNVDYFVELKKRPTRFEPFLTIWNCFINFKPHIVHTWDSMSTFYSYLPAKLNRAILINGSIRDAGIAKGWEYRFKRFFLKKADIAIANSIAGLNYYNVNGSVIYNSIDPGRFYRNDNNEKEFNIIMTANFSEYKDHNTFINAALMLLSENIVDTVFLAGDGIYRDQYIRYLESNYKSILPKFKFLGAINNVEHYLQKCKIGILCSTLKYREGISNAILEYMAAGLVPIATNVGGISEVIENGINGFLIKENDAKRICEIVKLLRLDHKLYSNTTERARATVIEKFNYQSNIDALINIYKSLA